MKKIITLIVVLMTIITMSNAQTTLTYTGKLNITAMAGFIKAEVNNVDVFYDENIGSNDVIRIEDMQLELLGANFAVGNITVKNVKLENGNISSTGTEAEPNLILSNGSDPNVEWIGGALPDMVGNVSGKRDDAKKTMSLNIPLPVEINTMTVTLNIKYEGNLTNVSGIENVVASDATPAPAFTISGLRANSNTKGIIIKGGKKYVNK